MFNLTMKSGTAFNKFILALRTFMGTTMDLMAAETASILQAPVNSSTNRYGRIYSNQILRGVTLKDVHKFNALWATAIGPACANIMEESSNFINCKPPTG